MRDNTVQGVTLGSPKSFEGCNSVNTCWNGASEESTDIYAKSRCQRTGHSIEIELGKWRYGHLKPHGL